MTASISSITMAVTAFLALTALVLLVPSYIRRVRTIQAVHRDASEGGLDAVRAAEIEGAVRQTVADAVRVAQVRAFRAGYDPRDGAEIVRYVQTTGILVTLRSCDK